MEHINIIGTLFDNSIEHVVAHASLVRDDSLGKDQLQINSELRRLINSALGTTQDELLEPIDLTEILNDIEDIKSAINNINDELGNREYTYLIFLTEAQYDALEEYEEDAVYFIMKDWSFDGKFPVILSGDSNDSRPQVDIDGEIGEFPITLT